MHLALKKKNSAKFLYSTNSLLWYNKIAAIYAQVSKIIVHVYLSGLTILLLTRRNNMSRKTKKSVSILLALVMLCGVLAVAPVAVSAAVTEYTTSTGGVYTFNSETGELHLVSGEFTGSPWSVTKSSVLSVTADEGVYFTGSCADMFYGFSKCTRINLRNVNTSSVTNMYRMFYNCTSLTNLNVSNFNTEKVTIIRAMFWQCSNLTELDLSSFNLQNVVDGNVTISGQSRIAYGGIFKDCIKLRSLTVSDKFKFIC